MLRRTIHHLLLCVLLYLVTDFVYPDNVHAQHTSAQCLSNAIYHEARGESVQGRRAVYEVIVHRAKSSGKSLCSVVKAPQQFQWLDRKPFLEYTVELKAMLEEVKNHPRVLLNDEKFFFHKSLKPKWAKKMKCREIGRHVFCSDKEKHK